jgi:hypothetical protein
VGAGYIDRNWPPACKDSGAWPLSGLRQSFLNGTLTRLLDPDNVLKTKLAEFVARGDFGLASGPKPDGTYERLWYPGDTVPPDEIAFEAGVVLLKKAKAEELKKKPATKLGDPTSNEGSSSITVSKTDTGTSDETGELTDGRQKGEVEGKPKLRTVRLSGAVPPELWNRLGTRVLPKLRSGIDLKIDVEFLVTVDAGSANDLQAELQQILKDLGLQDSVEVELP